MFGLPASPIPQMTLIQALRGDGVTPTLPEPAQDIRAQLQAVAAGNKPAMFVAAGNQSAVPENLPSSLHRADRQEGTLITGDRDQAQRFMAGGLTDDHLASYLGYPQPKSEALASPGASLVQARDRQGNVVSEAVTSRDRVPDAMRMLASHAPDGDVMETHPVAMVRRRLASALMERR
jgi:hypothetical protein